MLPERLGRTARVLSTATELTPNGSQQTRLEGDLDHPAHPLFGVSHFGPCGWISCAIRVFQLDFHTMLVSDPCKYTSSLQTRALNENLTISCLDITEENPIHYESREVFFGILQLSTKQNFAQRLTSLGKQPRRFINSSVV